MSRVRHESVGERSPKTNDRELRFPSPQVDSDQFLKIVSWQEPVEPEQRASPLPSTSEIAGTVRSWYRGLSRRTLFIALIVLVAVLFIAAIVITLVLALPSHTSNHGFTAIVFTMSTSSPPTPTPFPYPVGYVVATLSRYVALGTVTSLVPVTSAFTFKQQILAYGTDTAWLLSNSSIRDTTVTLNFGNCSSCTVLEIDEKCFSSSNHNCEPSQVIYCCSQCPDTGGICQVKGVTFEFLDEMVESRVTSSNDGLLLSTASSSDSTPCAVQSHRIKADGSTFSGPIQSCFALSSDETDQSKARYNYLSTTTIQPDNATAADILTVVEPNGGVRLLKLTSHTTLGYVPMRITSKVLSISTTIQGDYLLVAFLQSSRFYALRYNLGSGCIAVLNNYYQSFLFSGELQNFSWAADSLLLWYVYENGVNLVQFQFKWDAAC
ncbi:hypothetical protein Q1695_011842 [Nippostrongylus brasiliensis]|nr:hypothetical protein Q1695_011842 [Nippostrongylus brasiliensis]